MLYFLFFVDQYMADFGEPEVENLLDLCFKSFIHHISVQICFLSLYISFIRVLELFRRRRPMTY